MAKKKTLKDKDGLVVYPVTKANITYLSDNNTTVEGALENKVDAITGKGLSTNDYTTPEKTKLSGLYNYDDTVIKGSVANLDNRVTTAESGVTSVTNRVAAAESTVSNLGSRVSTNEEDIDDIESFIPAQTSTSNQLADKAFVNSTVQTGTANFRGNWDTWSAVPTNASSYPADYTGSKTPTINDYMVVKDASGKSSSLQGTWRFKYTGVWATNNKNGWHEEYQVNESPMTAAQLAALNSGITSEKVEKIDEMDVVKLYSTTGGNIDGSMTQYASTQNFLTSEPVGDVGDITFLNRIYPVGSIYISATLDTAVKVHNALGGSWEAFGAGRVLVGVDTAQTEFNTVGKTGGEKTVTIEERNLPTNSVIRSNVWRKDASCNTENTAYSSGWVNGAIGDSGHENNQPHNNLQPYITVYMYRRTA